MIRPASNIAEAGEVWISQAKCLFLLGAGCWIFGDYSQFVIPEAASAAIRDPFRIWWVLEIVELEASSPLMQ